MKAVSTYLGHYTPEFTEKTYTHPKEIARDCTMISEIWEEIHTISEDKENKIVQLIDLDYRSFFA